MILDIIFVHCIVSIGIGILAAVSAVVQVVCYAAAIVLLLVAYGISDVVFKLIYRTREYQDHCRGCNAKKFAYNSRHFVWRLWRCNRRINKKCQELLDRMVQEVLDTLF